MSFSDFVKPYPNGYIDGEAGNTPVTAAILNTNYDGFLLQLNDWATDIEEDIGSIQSTLNDKVDTSTFNQLGEAVRQIGLAVNSKSTVSISDLLQSGTKIATLTIDSTPYDIYAPSGGGGGSSVVWDQIQQTGTKIATITIDNVPVDVYVPTPIEELSDLTDVSITNLQNGQTLKWNSTTLKWENSNTSGGSGHTILDDDGTALAQEDNLQIKGVYSADNSQDGVTEVNVYREMTKAEFNTLSSDEKKGFIRVTDEPDIYSDGHFQPVIYSTEEREIGVWTDGKPLYEKTVDCGDLPNSSTKDVAHNILNIDRIISIIGMAKRSDGDTFTPMPDLDASSGTTPNNYLRFWANVTNIRIKTSSDRSNYTSSYATLRYTKTTDTVGSGTWTPQGVPTHKYSTEEHIIGTWIDGSTLYEKTVEVSHTFAYGDNDIELFSGVSFVSSDIKEYDVAFVNSSGYTSKLIKSLTDDTCYVNSNNKLVLYYSCNASGGIGARTVRVTIKYTKSS